MCLYRAQQINHNGHKLHTHNLEIVSLQNIINIVVRSVLNFIDFGVVVAIFSYKFRIRFTHTELSLELSNSNNNNENSSTDAFNGVYCCFDGL